MERPPRQGEEHGGQRESLHRCRPGWVDDVECGTPSRGSHVERRQVGRELSRPGYSDILGAGILSARVAGAIGRPADTTMRRHRPDGVGTGESHSSGWRAGWGVRCLGEREPVVVLLPGLVSSGLEWGAGWDGLAAHRVVVPDLSPTRVSGRHRHHPRRGVRTRRQLG